MNSDLEENKRVIQSCRDKAIVFQSKVIACKGLANYPLLIDAYWKWLQSVSAGLYASPEIEQYFIAQASKLPMSESIDAIPNTTLVVMSEAFEYGGHTRWVEKWIGADADRVYSLVLTRRPKNNLPKVLAELICTRGGKVYYLSDKASTESALLDDAMELRKLSLGFSSILIAVHMDDPLPLIAYGSEDFTRPIAFLNHGNHLFWLGVSISDVIVECGEWQQRLSIQRRGATQTELLEFPSYVAMLESKEPRNHLRRRLAIPESAFVVMTAGPATKYGADRGVQYSHFIDQILALSDKTYFIAIGMKWAEVPEWHVLRVQYPQRIAIIDKMPLGSLHEYCFAADILVDSFPFTGGGVMWEASVCGCPCFTQRRTFDPMPYLNHFEDIGTLLAKIKECVEDKNVYQQVKNRCVEETKKILTYDTAYERVCQFMPRLDTMAHRIHNFEPHLAPIDDNDYVVLATRYFKNADKTLGRYIFWYAMKPQFLGRIMVLCYSCLRNCYGRFRNLLAG